MYKSNPKRKKLSKVDLEEVSGGVTLRELLAGKKSTDKVVVSGNISYNKVTGNFILTVRNHKIPIGVDNYVNLKSAQTVFNGLDKTNATKDMQNLLAICNYFGVSPVGG